MQKKQLLKQNDTLQNMNLPPFPQQRPPPPMTRNTIFYQNSLVFL